MFTEGYIADSDHEIINRIVLLYKKKYNEQFFYSRER